MRLSCAAATLFGALLLLLLPGAVMAHADVSFTVAESEAAPGDDVHFTISGTDSGATYALEIDGTELTEGSVPAESISGQFTMPDLGNASMAVTVEAHITQSEETMTLEDTLQYLAQPRASAGATQTQPTPVLAPAAAARPAPASGPQHADAPASVARSAPASVPGSLSEVGRRSAPHRARGKRHARRSPRRTAERRTAAPHTASQESEHRRAHASRGSASARRLGATSAALHLLGNARTPPGAGQDGAPSRADRSLTSDTPNPLAGVLAAPPSAAIFSVASGVASSESGAPVTAAIVLVMMALTALAVASGQLTQMRRPVRRRRKARPTPAGHKARRCPGDRNGARPLPQPQETEPGYSTKRMNGATAAEGMAASLEEVAASFGSISLVDLDRRAKLATRTERKFILDASTFERLIGEFNSHYLVLEIEGARVFPYDTIYFDTPALLTYRQHLQGRRRRFKCRTRLYAVSGLCFFEVKLKGGRGETIKRKLRVEVGEHGSLTAPALAFLERQLQKAYGAPPPADLAPVLRTSYRRLTLAGRRDSERLTFDFELKFAARDEEYSIQPGRVLLETKTNGDGGEANSVLKRLGVHPVTRCSKYCLGVALSHPELRDNPFRPLLRKHFDGYRHVRPRTYDGAIALPAAELEAESQPITPALPTWQEA